jgi:hypothetical protein
VYKYVFTINKKNCTESITEPTVKLVNGNTVFFFILRYKPLSKKNKKLDKTNICSDNLTIFLNNLKSKKNVLNDLK